MSDYTIKVLETKISALKEELANEEDHIEDFRAAIKDKERVKGNIMREIKDVENDIEFLKRNEH